MGWAHLARNVEGLVTRGSDGTRTGVWARSLYRPLLADRSAFVADRTSLRTSQRRTRQMQSGSGARFAGVMLTVAATCRLHGVDLFAYLAGVCTASMAGLAVPQILPAPV